ncbi:MAG TPA: thioesterase [Prolixibacteraceae bacterium]|nr:thioesterase [Prolixibacteraceae bacterium]HCR89257.1 thioesterase [Prolixibacteraceae bacterium]HCU61648.1 thioesterase [Prolixibacteraceae bacterium]
MLNAGEKYLNHLNTVHASAQFALAEATSGFFLLNEFQQLPDIIPVVRKVETKYKKPVEGTVYSKAGLLDTDRMKVIDELDKRKRALLTVRVSLFDSGQVNVMQSDFEWFIAKNS